MIDGTGQLMLFTGSRVARPALPASTLTGQFLAFACSGELMPYERCIFYTVVLAVVALDRPTLKSKVGCTCWAPMPLGTHLLAPMRLGCVLLPCLQLQGKVGGMQRGMAVPWQALRSILLTTRCQVGCSIMCLVLRCR